jgi:peptidoglycan/LPS O-acetylase OafA/YrhL
LLRFALAICVLLGHISTFRFDDIFVFWVGGSQAIAGFFIVSGFSIACSLADRPQGYWRRRIVRIYPLSIFSIGFAIAAFLLIGRVHLGNGDTLNPPHLVNIVCSLFLLNGLLRRTPQLFGPLWSLDCEMIYYACAPILKRLSRYGLICVGLLSLELFLSVTGKGNLALQYRGEAAIGLAWLWILGFYAYRYRLTFWASIPMAFVMALVVWTRQPGPLSAVWAGVVVPWLMVAHLSWIAIPRRAIACANYLGNISYPLYLLHMQTIWMVLVYTKGMGSLDITMLCIVIPLVLAIAAYHLVDLPARAVLGRYRFQPGLPRA